MRHIRVTCDVCGEPSRYSFSLQRGDGVYNIYDGGYGVERDLCVEHADLVIQALDLPSDLKRGRPGIWKERSGDAAAEQKANEVSVGESREPSERDQKGTESASEVAYEATPRGIRGWFSRR